MTKLTLLATLAKNVGIGCADNLSLGMASAFKNTINEIAEGTKITNETLYYMQVRTFLETIDLDQHEVDQFFQENPYHLKLGMEIFKILEQTVVDEQAKMLARAFSCKVRNNYSELSDFDKDIFIIKNMDKHLLNMFKQFGQKPDKNDFQGISIKHLEYLDLVRIPDPLMWSDSNILQKYQISEVGLQFYNRILKNL